MGSASSYSPPAEQVADLLDVRQERLVLVTVLTELTVPGVLHQELLPLEVRRRIPGELIGEPLCHPGPPLLDRVGQRPYHRDLQVMLAIHGLVSELEPIAPDM